MLLLSGLWLLAPWCRLLLASDLVVIVVVVSICSVTVIVGIIVPIVVTVCILVVTCSMFVGRVAVAVLMLLF